MRRGRKGACELFSRVQATICWGKKRCPAVETNFMNFGDFRIFSVQKMPKLTLKEYRNMSEI